MKGQALIRSGEMVELANPGARLLARVIDIVIMSVPLVVLLVGLVNWDASFGLVGPLRWQLALAVTGALYEVPMIAKKGQTLGKTAARIRVVRADDAGAPRWRDSVVRWVVPAALGCLPYVGGILWLLVFVSLIWDDARQGWHDDHAGTLVVKARTSSQ